MIKLIHGADTSTWTAPSPAWLRTRPPSGGGSSGSSSPAWPGSPGTGRPIWCSWPATCWTGGRPTGDRPGPAQTLGRSPAGAHCPGQPRPLYGQVPVRRPGLAGQRPHFFHRGPAVCGNFRRSSVRSGGTPSPPPTGRTTPWRASGPGAGGVDQTGGPHGEAEGKGDYAPISKVSIAGSGLDYLALGHIHQYSGLQREGNTFWAYPAAPRAGALTRRGTRASST